MTTLLAVERIKLFTTRSPWWSVATALALTVGFGALYVGTSNSADAITVPGTQIGYNFGLVVVMVMAALAVTTEYRFGTIRATFQAVPNRMAAMAAKTTVVALLAALIGELAAFGSWAVGLVLKPHADLALNSAFDWRTLAGTGLVYALAAVIALSVGILVRQSAGAISIVLIYTMLAEPLISMIPGVGHTIHKWMPFTMAHQFLTANSDLPADPESASSGLTIGPWWALAAFAAFTAILLGAALVTANKRDA
jgi:ABC-2 type transport system permease protein